MARIYNAALPILYVVLRILIILNWVVGAAILAVLAWSFTFTPEQWESALRRPASPELIIGLRTVAVLGLVSIPINYGILKRLAAMVRTVRSGDPFVAENAYRLQAIAWFLLVLQVLSMIIGGIGNAISTREHPVDLDAGFSVNGWLAVLLTFVLARIFAEGTLMREDLEGTV